MAIVTTATHQKAVLSAVLSLTKRDSVAAARRANYLTTQTRVEHYTQPYQIIFKALLIYYRHVGSPISYEHFVDIAKRQGMEELEFNSTVTAFVELQNTQPAEENEFRYQIIRLRELTKSDSLVDALVETMDVLQTGKRLGKRMLFGYEAALNNINRRTAELGRNDDETNVGYFNKDMIHVLQDYSDRKFGRKPLYSTNFGEIDDSCSGGLQGGDLAFLAAYTSEGKSTLLNTLIDNWVFGGQKLNVVVGTAEHPPKVVQRKLVAIRSADPRYGATLDYKKLKEGRLGLTEERVLETIVQDMSQNDKYGNLAIFAIPNGSTTNSVFDTVAMYNQIFPVHIFAWDYIGYTESDRKRDSVREEMSYVVRSAKVQSQNFDHKRGLATVSPFQVSRGKWEKALTAGHYTMACMEETSAAEKAADILWSILQLEGKSLGQLLKNRDGPKWATPFEMSFDRVCMRFVPRAKSVSL